MSSTDKEKYFTHQKYGLTSTNYLEWLPQIEGILQASNGYEYTQETMRLVDVQVPNPAYNPDLDDVEIYENEEREQEPRYIIEQRLRQVPLIERPNETIIKYEPAYTRVANTDRYKINNSQFTRKEFPNPEHKIWLKKSGDV